MVDYLIIILTSFIFTFLISIPFIKLLFKYNIRRLTEVNLDNILPGRSNVKLGTPIMGGTVIIITILILSTLLLNTWIYFWSVILLVLLGALVGAYDEYTNALGKTLFAIRKSKSTKSKPYSFIKEGSFLFKIKKILLIPWKWFEESIRVMGSNQRGVKAHYKFLMHIGLALIPVVFLIINGHQTNIYFPLLGELNLSFLYWLFLIILFVMFSNAFGITDGMDGLSAGTHSISFAFLGLLAATLGFKEIAYLAFFVVGAELAFLYFNIKPARMQMSDVGTVPLGMLFAFIGVLMKMEFVLIFVGAIFLIEFFSSIGQQWSVKLRKKRIFLVAPIHHHFEKKGWTENKVVERFWLFTVISGLTGLIIVLL